jgi:polygalacturonase
MELHLEQGAVIKATERLADFGLPEPLPATQKEVDGLRVKMTPLISGANLGTFVLSGEGTIDGSGEVWWQHVNKLSYYKDGNLLLPRPRLVQLGPCENLVVKGVTLTNSPTFHLVPTKCDNVLIDGVHIVAPAKAPNTDAIDPSGSKNILIRKCTLDVGGRRCRHQGRRQWRLPKHPGRGLRDPARTRRIDRQRDVQRCEGNARAQLHVRRDDAGTAH